MTAKKDAHKDPHTPLSTSFDAQVVTGSSHLHIDSMHEQKNDKDKTDFLPLMQARTVLYEHIKSTSVGHSTRHEQGFFLQANKNHRRDLVAIMRKIDSQHISSVEQLLSAMRDLALIHQSEPLNKILHIITDIEPQLDIENSVTPPRS